MSDKFSQGLVERVKQADRLAGKPDWQKCKLCGVRWRYSHEYCVPTRKVVVEELRAEVERLIRSRDGWKETARLHLTNEDDYRAERDKLRAGVQLAKGYIDDCRVAMSSEDEPLSDADLREVFRVLEGYLSEEPDA